MTGETRDAWRGMALATVLAGLGIAGALLLILATRAA
jgi:hypothetical protein